MSDYEELIQRVLTDKPSMFGPSASSQELMAIGDPALESIENALMLQAPLVARVNSEELPKALRAVDPLIRVYGAIVTSATSERAVPFLERINGPVRTLLAQYLCGRFDHATLPVDQRRRIHALLKSGNESERDVARWLLVTRRLDDVGLKLKVLGYWSDKRTPSPLPDPKNLVDPNWREDREKITNYLKSGLIAAQYMGFSYCRFECGIPAPMMGDSDLSDGTWVWPQGLAHYVEKHQVILPAEFVEHLKANGFRVNCNLTSQDLESLQHDFGFWRGWSAGPI